MSAASSSSAPPPSAAPPIGTVPRPATPARPASPARAEAVRDTGTVRRESVRTSSWTARGTVKVQGDVDVGGATTVGLVAIGGRLTAGRFRARGTLEVTGPTDVRETLSLDGTVRLDGPVHAGSLDARGTLRSGGELRVDRALSISGQVEVPSARVGLLDLTGSATVPGAIDAVVSVRARFRGDSELGIVRARSVVLAGPPTAPIPTLWRTVFGGRARVHVGRIEAESVELSAVDVGFVHGTSIVLGPGAHVTEIEGTVVRRHATSRVGPESRSAPPHGLSR
ncbi:MAG: hypothetical protein ACRECT_04755 [Thermoplasmata archaeon]